MKSKIILLLILFAVGIISARATVTASKYFVSVAGHSGPFGSYPSAAGTLAITVPIGTAAGTAMDAEGNIFFTDPTNNVICEIEEASGYLFIIAGIAGGAGDGLLGIAPGSSFSGLPTACSLSSPQTIICNPIDHNLYFTDNGTNRVCMIQYNTTAHAYDVIYNIVGTGSATSGAAPYDYQLASGATLNNPKGLAIDNRNILYVADAGNSLVRKISINDLFASPATCTIDIFAGNTGAAPHYATGSGAPNAKTISLSNTIEGLTFYYNSRYGTGTLYIAESGQGRVLAVNLYTVGVTGAGELTTAAGSDNTSLPLHYAANSVATATRLDNPTTIAVADNGDLFIGNYNGVVVVNGAGAQDYAGYPTSTSSVGLSNCSTANSDMGLTAPVGLFCLRTSGRYGIVYADNANHLIRRLENPTPDDMYNCGYPALSEFITVKGGAINSIVSYNYSGTIAGSAASGSAAFPAFTPTYLVATTAPTYISLDATGTVNFQVNDRVCSLRYSTPSIACCTLVVNSSTAPAVQNVTATSDEATTGGMVLYKATDPSLCNCGTIVNVSGREARTNYYLQTATASFPAYYTPSCGDGVWGAISPASINCGMVTPISSGSGFVHQTFTIIAEKDGCTTPMNGSIDLDDPSTPLPPYVTVSSTFISPCIPSVTYTVHNPVIGKEYVIDPVTSTGYSHVATSTAPYSFPARTTPGIHYVYENPTFGVAHSLCGSEVNIDARDVTIDMILPMHVTGDLVYTFCGGTLTLQANAVGFTPTTYEWFIGSAATGTVVGTSASFSPSGSSTSYTVRVSSATSCAIVKTVQIVIPSAGSCTPCEYFKVTKYNNYPYNCSPSTSCTTCSTIQPFHTITATTITSANVPTDRVNNVWIKNSATLTGSYQWGSAAFPTVIFVSQNCSLNVAANADITFNNTHIFAGDCIDYGVGTTYSGWHGFKVQSNTTSVGKLSLVNNTLVENVYGNSSDRHAVTVNVLSTHFAPSDYNIISGANCVLNCDGGILNKCNYHMDLNYAPSSTNYVYELPFRIENSVFTNREFECYYPGFIAASTPPVTATDYYPFTWPDATLLKTQVVEPTIGMMDAYDPRFNLDAFNDPYSSTFTTLSNHNYGIKWQGGFRDASLNFYEIAIGNRFDPAKSNVFDNITAIGITCAMGGNMSLRNSTFRKMASTSSIGVSVVQSSSGPQNRLRVLGDGSNTTNCGNTFRNCNIGVSVNGRYDVTGNQSTVSSYNAHNPSTGAVTGIGDYAYSLSTSSNRLEFLNNVIFNVRSGISAYTTGLGSWATADFNNNTISAATPCSGCYSFFPTGTGPSMTGVSGSLIRGAIRLQSNITASSAFYQINMNNNNITGAAYGITGNAIEMVGDPATGTSPDNVMNINSNTIHVTDYNSSFKPAGIYLLTSCRAHGRIEINDNTIEGDGSTAGGYTLPTGNWNRVVRGMWISNIGNVTGPYSKSNIRCNYIHDINNAFNFDAPSAGTTNFLNWRNNTMKRDEIGMAYGGSSSTVSIGVQGGTGDPSDNYWEDDAAFHWTGTHYATWALSANPAAGVLKVRPNPGSTPDYNPTNNGFSTSSTRFSTASGTISVLSGTLPALADCVHAHSPKNENTPISINGNGQDVNYSLFPNPTTGSINITQKEVVDGTVAARVVNIVGASVFEGNIDFAGGQSQLNLQDVVPGIYIIELKDAYGHRFTSKVIVEK